jgi:hypothetical protein
MFSVLKKYIELGKWMILRLLNGMPSPPEFRLASVSKNTASRHVSQEFYEQQHHTDLLMVDIQATYGF